MEKNSQVAKQHDDLSVEEKNQVGDIHKKHCLLSYLDVPQNFFNFGIKTKSSEAYLWTVFGNEFKHNLHFWVKIFSTSNFLI